MVRWRLGPQLWLTRPLVWRVLAVVLQPVGGHWVQQPTTRHHCSASAESCWQDEEEEEEEKTQGGFRRFTSQRSSSEFNSTLTLYILEFSQKAFWQKSASAASARHGHFSHSSTGIALLLSVYPSLSLSIYPSLSLAARGCNWVVSTNKLGNEKAFSVNFTKSFETKKWSHQICWEFSRKSFFFLLGQIDDN